MPAFRIVQMTGACGDGGSGPSIPSTPTPDASAPETVTTPVPVIVNGLSPAPSTTGTFVLDVIFFDTCVLQIIRAACNKV
jgi:hypothetical protein